MTTKLIPATLEDYPTIQNMARFYVYEMSRECGLNSTDWACPADGLYESFDFKHYFTDMDRKAYLVKVNEELAGFVLIYQTGEQSNAQWHMGEFFILARFQHRGIGRLAAQQVWEHHPGSWEVTVIPENQRALQFWRKAITAIVNHHFVEEIKLKEGRVDPDQPNRIFLTFDTKKANTSPDKRTIQITPASIQQQAVIAQLYELYTYEMTDLADFDINDDGYYRYQELPLFWSTPNRYPYLILVDNKLAGFALIQQGSPIDDAPDVWDIAEFFIMRKFRKKGIGQFVAKSVWEAHPGLWQIRVWENNLVAHQFWNNIVKNFTKKSILPERVTYQGHDGLLVYKFKSTVPDA